MAKRAKIIDDQVLESVLNYVRQGDAGLRDTVMLLLSHKAGLRAAEIAGLTWGDMLDAVGTISPESFTVPNNIAKYGRGRTIPMHPLLYKALIEYKGSLQKITARTPLIPGKEVGKMSPNNTAVYLRRIYNRVGLIGCSSHSGRRTFITKAARMVNDFDCSLVDVQRLAGHSDLSTTELYIEASGNVAAMVHKL